MCKHRCRVTGLVGAQLCLKSSYVCGNPQRRQAEPHDPVPGCNVMYARLTGELLRIPRPPVRAVLLLSVVAACAGVCGRIAAQGADFQIVWVVVGEAESNTGERPARVGRHLFMAPDLIALSLKNVKVSRIDVAPSVTQIAAGQRLCVSSLNIIAYGPVGDALKRAPLSISVRQDQKQRLDLERDAKDVCVTPSAPGEYPIRFASLLPAPDGTTRGAQIFLRVGSATADSQAARSESP
jgi:hypothetical protein